MINLLLIVVGILLGVAFFTLLERKILGFIHLRLGPNKVFRRGLLQPIRDAIKLFSKEIIIKSKALRLFIILSPVIFIILSLLYWISFNSIFSIIYLSNIVLIIFSIFSLNVYPLLIIGFISFSKFRLSGSYRSISQSISYEISLIMYVFSFQLISGNLNILENNFNLNVYYLAYFSIPLMFYWIILCLVERNRTPFDLSEGESELVRGFNTEYEGGLFSLIFIREYSSLLFLSSFTVLIFLRGVYFSFFVIIISAWIIWTRGSFPRFRYDELIIIAWKIFLPFSLLLFLIFL